ncbi:hypothetical protein FD755_007214 [Muntiacus reevesi]|uniref:Transmembrane protein 126A n=1 Tax=Muntiacus reevesi TaxID=9886 RepID=A0A5J5MH06_MUNRE|nr:hypothetical protein FD755_007214 [Muntiacus reevesi]
MEHHEPDDTVKENLIDILIRKINQLLEAERNLLENGSTYIGLNAAFCGLIANSLFQPILPMSQTHMAGGLPKATIFDGTHILQRFCDLHCETCTNT